MQIQFVAQERESFFYFEVRRILNLESISLSQVVDCRVPTPFLCEETLSSSFKDWSEVLLNTSPIRKKKSNAPKTASIVISSKGSLGSFAVYCNIE